MSTAGVSITVHLMAGDGIGDDLLADLEPVVSRKVSIVYPSNVLAELVQEVAAQPSLQTALNQNVAEVRREFDALKNFEELGLLPRTDDQSDARYIDSSALLAQRNPTVQKAYENLFRCSLNITAISKVFEERTGEALPIAIQASPPGNP